MSKEKEDYIKMLGNKEYLDELWGEIDDEVQYLHKRLSDIWNHPTNGEVTWFHETWERLSQTVKEYFEAEREYLPDVEKPKSKVDNYEVGVGSDQSEEVKRRYGDGWHLTKNIEFLAPDRHTLACSVLSHAIQDVENLGGFKVVAAIVDLNKDTDVPIEERLQAYCTVESKKLREVIYKEIEMEKDYE